MRKSSVFIRTLTLSAMLVAISIVLTRFLPIYIGSDKRIAFGDLPIMLAGIWLGPIGGGAVGLVADIAGSFISPFGWYPPLTIPPVLVGVITGLLRHLFIKDRPKFLLIGSMTLLTNIICAMGLTTFFLHMLYGTDFFVLLLPRAAISLLITLVETIAITLIIRALGEKPVFLVRRSKSMNTDEALAYIHSVSWKGSVPGLSRTRELLRLLNNPERSLRFVHVAGTNGKGSVSAMLYNILLSAGVKAGLYTSPFIESFNERIQAQGRLITDDELAYVTGIVKQSADTMKDKPTEFELITCIAFEYFKRKGIDIVVLEVGMGGELDSTNVIDSPLAVVITAMSLDHTQILGDTMEEIASAKAGVIKRNTEVISYGNNETAEKVFLAAAERLCAHIRHADFNSIVSKSYGLLEQRFDYGRYKDIRLSLVGEYQMKNAAVAIETVEVLRDKGVDISDKAIIDGLERTEWSARFEVINKNPPIIVDGGHNPDGIKRTAESLERLFADKKIVFIMGVMADKDVDSMTEIICPLAERFFTVKPNNPRAMDANALADLLRGKGMRSEACESMYEAAEKALTAAGKHGVICAIGSLYMAADIKNALKKAMEEKEKTA